MVHFLVSRLAVWFEINSKKVVVSPDMTLFLFYKGSMIMDDISILQQSISKHLLNGTKFMELHYTSLQQSTYEDYF